MKKSLSILCALCVLCVNSQATTVLFTLQSLTGIANNRLITVWPDVVQNPLVLGTNLVPLSAFTLQPVGGQVTTNLAPWGYTIKVDGWPRSAHIIVPNSTDTINVATLINTNAFSPLNIFYPNRTNSDNSTGTNVAFTGVFNATGGNVSTNGGRLNADSGGITSDGFGDLTAQQMTATLYFGNLYGSVTGSHFGNGSGLTNLNITGSGGVTNRQSGVVLNNGLVVSKPLFIQPVLRVLGHSYNVTIYASNGAPYNLTSSWSVYGGYSNRICIFYTNNQAFYNNANNYGASNNIAWPLMLISNLYATKGWVMTNDSSCAVPGLSCRNMFGAAAGQACYQNQDYVGANVSYNGSGSYTMNWPKFLNTAITFGDTNSISVSINGTTYTNPFYLGIANFSAPTNMYFVASNGPHGQYYSAVCTGTASARVLIYQWANYYAGQQSKFAPPYELNSANDDGTSIGPMNYLLTNSPASNGIPASLLFLGFQNEWNATPYFPDSTWTNYWAQCNYNMVSNGLTRLANARYNVFLCTEPGAPNFAPGSSQSNLLTLVNGMVRTQPITNVTVVDMNASNTVNQSTPSLYIDGTHAATALAILWGTYFNGGVSIPNATFNALVAGFGGNADGQQITNLNGAYLQTGSVGPAALDRTYLTTNNLAFTFTSGTAAFTWSTNVFTNVPGLYATGLSANQKYGFKLIAYINGGTPGINFTISNSVAVTNSSLFGCYKHNSTIQQDVTEISGTTRTSTIWTPDANHLIGNIGNAESPYTIYVDGTFTTGNAVTDIAFQIANLNTGIGSVTLLAGATMVLTPIYR